MMVQNSGSHYEKVKQFLLCITKRSLESIFVRYSRIGKTTQYIFPESQHIEDSAVMFIEVRVRSIFTRIKRWDIEWFIEGQAFSRSYDLAAGSSLPPPPPTPPPKPPVRKLEPATHRKTEKERQIYEWRWGGGGRGAESYDCKRKPDPL